MTKSDPTTNDPAAARAAPEVAARACRVLIVEDSPDDLAEIRRLLLRGSERRYQFVEAQIGAAGVRAVLDADHPPDCVFLDYNLPDMNALEVLAALAGPDGLTACPVVVLTGTVGHEQTRAVLRAGAQDYIGKGWMTPESLTRAVENATAHWAMARELHEQKAALRASEGRLRQAVEVAGLGINLIDYATNTVVPDAAAAAMFGLEAGVPIPRSAIHDRFHPDDRAEVFRRMERSLDPTGDGCFTMEHRVVHPDSTTKWLSVREQVAFADADGVRRPVSGVLAALDVTERKRAEKALRARTDEIETLLDTLPGFVWISRDAECRVIVGNRTANEFLGVAAAANVSQSVVATGEAPYFRQLKEDGTEYRVDELPLQRAMATGVPVRDAVLDFHFGDSRRAHVVGDAVPLFDERGRVRGGLAVFVDITDRKREETALKVSETRYRRLFESAKDGILILDAHAATITDANPFMAEMLGYSQDEFVGKELWQIGLFKDVEASKAAMRELQEKGYIRYGDLPLETKAGRRINVEFVSNVYGENGDAVIQCNIRDISERKQAEDELRRLAAELSEADRRKDEFLATLAHELRNPLAPIRNGLQVMKLAGGDAVAVEKSRSMMERQVGQMAHLIDDLMDVARIRQGKIVLKRSRLRLAEAVQDAVDIARPLIQERGHTFSLDVPSESFHVDADRTRLAQVFSNLLNNAAKYTDRRGRIRLALERQGSDVVVSVEDNGVGIPADMLPRVFDMFAQVDRSLEKSQGGLGIGLNIVKRLVEMHDGSIVAESGGHGRGSRFVVRLPVVLTVATEKPNHDGDEMGKPAARRRILVVDDNTDSADSLGQLLEMLGNEVRTANDGEAGVGAAAEFRPDVILMDIGMPKLNGYEAARRIRAEGWGRNMVLVALTGWGQDDDRRKTSEAGFDHHLVKPVEAAALMKLLAGFEATTA